jgi:hypothetical protein
MRKPTPVSPARALLPLALALALPLSLSAEEVAIANTTFSNITEGAPEGWRAYPPPSGEGTSIEAVESGGVRLKDSDPANGLGFGQYMTAIPGHEYKVTLKTAGDATKGGIMASLVFLPKKPGKMAMINKTKIGEETKWVNPGDTAEFSATAPQGTSDAWLILYSPKATKLPTEIDLVSIKVDDVGGSTENAPAPKMVRGADTTKPRPENEFLPPGTVKVIDFETGDLSQARLVEGATPVVGQAPEHPVRHGKYSMRTTLTHNDHRSEITSFRARANGEFKYGWSIYLPKEFDGKSWFSIITQWHSWGTGRDYPMAKPGPPTCLTVSNDRLQLKLMYQEKPEDTTAAVKFFDLGPIEGDRDKWMDFVMEVDWQGPTSGKGYLRLFKNGEQILDYKGSTWFDDKLAGPFFKLGTYKGSGTWKGEEPGAVVYSDEFRMTDGSGTKDMVDPAKVKSE